MKNLVVWQKLTLLGLVFLLPLIVVLASYLSSVNTLGIDAARKEILGVEYTLPLLELLRDLQQRRGLAAALGAGGTALRNAFAEKTADVERALAAVATVDARIGKKLRLGEEWPALERECRALLPFQESAAAHAVEEHTRVIGRLLAFLAVVGDRSVLTLDPDLPTYYLQDVLIVRLPQHAEAVGRAWMHAATAPTDEALSPATQVALQRATAVIDQWHGAANDSLTKAVGYARDIEHLLENLALPADPADDPLRLAASGSTLTLEPIPRFHLMTVRLVADYDLAQSVGAALTGLLHERIVRLSGGVRAALLWGVLGLGAVLAVSGWIIRDITRPLGGLVATARAIGGGAKDASVDVPPRADEIGELATAFRAMLTAQRESRDKLVEGNLELLAANEKLQAATHEADAANRAKRDFLAVMSHEIRTPMNGILGMTELALSTALTATQREYLEMARSSAESLLALLNDLLDFSKIEAGKLELDRAPFDLRDSLGDTLHTLAVRAQEKGLELALHILPDVPDALLGDAFRLRQVIVNLVGNAIKFTDAGEVAVHVENGDVEGGVVALRFIVRDTGIGIPPESRARIFEAFAQADVSTTRRFGGTGLGLSIAAQIVALMGGRIELESTEGRGSTFRFTAHFGVRPERPALVPEALADVRVLVVDDNATNRLILREIFTSWRMEVAVAEDAARALAVLENSQRGKHPFSLVVTDLMMPELDGFGFVARIRSAAALRDLRIIMLTSANRPGDAERCADLGIGAHLAKPVKHSMLMDAIVDVLGPGGQAASPTAPPAYRVPAQRPLRILLAEDNKTNQRLAVANLEAWGHRVAVASDGTEAVALSAREPFDLILMDSQMPRMSGMEATAAIRQSEHGTSRRTPIVAMTASVMKGFREECLAAGMDGYVPKPIRREELVAAMAAAVPGLLTTAAPAAVVPPAAPPFDVTRALAAVGGNRGVLREMARLCLGEDAPRLFKQLREAAAQRDFSGIEHAAHGIKGLVGEFRATAARAAAAQLETAGHAKDGANLEAQIAGLEREFERFATALRGMPQ